MEKRQRLFNKSFGYAYAGLLFFIKQERNAKIHIVGALLAITLGLLFQISSNEWLILILTMALVFVTEIINTTLEKCMDFITTEHHPKIKVIKDMAAGAVLLSAVTALIIGGTIFIPKCWVLF